MTETIPPAGIVACGNCGATVASTGITCPTCGVLLAAYQAPAGSLGNPTSGALATPPLTLPDAVPPAIPDAFTVPPAPDLTISPPVSTLPPPVRHIPSTFSPIDDAMRRSRGDDVETAPLSASEANAGELAQMATGASPLAQEVEAELSGAKVTFDGGTPVLVTGPPPASPAAPENAPSIAVPPVPVVTTARAGGIDVPVPPPPPPRPRRLPVPMSTAESGGPPQVLPQSSRPIRWMPILVIVGVFLIVGRSVSSAGSVLALILGVVVVIWLLRMAAAMTGRKTTSMPWDDASRNRRRK